VKMTKITPGVSSIRIDFGSPRNNYDDDNDDVGASTASASGTGRDVGEMEKYLGLLRREASMDPFDYEVTRRTDYLSWDEYFMGVAFLSGHRSKDPMTQVGACLVDADKCIVGIGYNGFPRGCSDDVLPWARSAPDELHKKYPYGELEALPFVIFRSPPPLMHPVSIKLLPVALIITRSITCTFAAVAVPTATNLSKVVHAEVNAILNKCSASVRGATLYVALFPCVSKLSYIFHYSLPKLIPVVPTQNECAKVIIQSGICEVVYLNDHYHDTDSCRASRIMFEMAGVKLRRYLPKRREIVIDFRV
jgi:dCMP deaminase